RFPVRREIGLCAVVAVPHVVNCDLVAIDLCPSCLCNIRLPRAIVAWLKHQPPQRNKRGCSKDDCELQQFSTNEDDCRDQDEHEQKCCQRTCRWKIKVERAERPCDTNNCRNPSYRTGDESQCFHRCHNHRASQSA